MINNLLLACQLPFQMRNLVVADDTVTFRVALGLEFSVQLTVLGDSPSQPGSLLGLDMLVEDRETSQGKARGHSLGQTGKTAGVVWKNLP